METLNSIGGVSAWRRGDLDRDGVVAQLEELPGAVQHELLHAASVPLPRANYAREAKRVTSQLREPFATGAFVELVSSRVFAGPGVLVLRGLPLEPEDHAAYHDVLVAILSAFGDVLSQDIDGHSVYTVIDRSDPRGFYGGSRSTGALRYHTDQAAAPEHELPQLLALWCLQPAEAGGETVLASGHALHDELLAQGPELAASLYQPLPFGRDADGVSAAAPILSQVFRSQGELRVRYNHYFVERGAAQTGRAVTDVQRDALEACEALLASDALSEKIPLGAGDLLLVDNRFVLHNRTAYRDSHEDRLKRRLLRGWARCAGLPVRAGQ